MLMIGLFSNCQVGYVNERPIFKYGQFVGKACQKLESWCLTTTVREVLPDKTVTVQDKI